TTADGLYLIASIKGATSGGNDVYCLPLPARAGWIRVTPDGEASNTVLGTKGSQLWLFTTRGAGRGRVVALDLASPSPDTWETVIPEGKEAIAALDQTGGGNALGLFGDRIVLNYLRDGRPVLRVLSLTGRLEHEVAVAPGDFIWGGLRGLS